MSSSNNNKNTLSLKIKIKISLPKILVYDDVDWDSFFSECVKSFRYNYKIFGNAGVIFFQSKYY